MPKKNEEKESKNKAKQQQQQKKKAEGNAKTGSKDLQTNWCLKKKHIFMKRMKELKNEMRVKKLHFSQNINSCQKTHT